MLPIWKSTLIAASICIGFLAIWAVWEFYLSYYWHTKAMTLYQKNDEFRLCDGTRSLFPVWDPNEAYYIHSAKAEKAVKDGIPITFEVRGVIDHTVQEIFIAEINEIEIGVNNQCETEH